MVSRASGAVCLIAVSTMGLDANATLACPSPPPPLRDLNVPPFYEALRDPELAAISAAAMRPYNGYLSAVASQADLSLSAPTPMARAEAGRCAGEWLAAWAQGQGWLGHMATRQSEYRRNWNLAGLAIAYLKIKPHVTSEQRSLIEPWLDRIATVARNFFVVRRSHRRNNHWYWLGLGLAATGLATDNERHWDEARRIMFDAAHDIRADGTLPMELDRGPRALHYHAFSATPLIMLAELGAARGEDWYSLGNGALHRLVGLTVAGLRNPALFTRLAGPPQVSAQNVPTLLMYHQRFAGRISLKGVPKVPTQHLRLGGDVALLSGLLATKRIAASTFMRGEGQPSGPRL